MKQVSVVGIQVEQSSGAPILLLRELEDPQRVLPLFIGPAEANSIALAMTGRRPPRPTTHDLMTTVLEMLGSHVDAVEVTELTNGTFHAALVLETPEGSHRIDTRPSDAIALAVRNDAPIYASDAVLDEAAAVVARGIDDEGAFDLETIEAEVEEFRSMLESFDPSKLSTGDTPEDESPDDSPSEG